MNPDLARTHSDWGPRVASPIRVWGEWVMAALAVAFLVFPLLVCLVGLMMAEELGAIHYAMAIVGCVGGLVGGVRLFGTSGRIDRRRSRAVMHSLEADDGEIAVRVSYALSGSFPRLGEDTGALCAEDGWLIFRGVRTEWSVRATDVTPGRSRFSYPGGGETALLVEFDALSQPDRLRVLLDDWRHRPPPPGRPVFPPAVIAPQHRAWPSWTYPFFALTALAAGWTLGTVPPPVRVVLALCVLGTVVAAVAYRHQDRRALRRAGALPE